MGTPGSVAVVTPPQLSDFLPDRQHRSPLPPLIETLHRDHLAELRSVVRDTPRLNADRVGQWLRACGYTASSDRVRALLAELRLEVERGV